MAAIFGKQKKGDPVRKGKKRRKVEGGKFAVMLEKGAFGRWVLGVLVFGLAVMVISWQGTPLSLPVKGQLSNRPIVAACDFSFADLSRTEQAREAAAASQPFVYPINPKVFQEKEESLNLFFIGLEKEKAKPEETAGRGLSHPQLTEEQFSLLLDSDDLPALKREVARVLSTLYRNGILPRDVKETLVNAGQDEIMIYNEETGDETVREISGVTAPDRAAGEIGPLLEKVYPDDTDLLEALKALTGGLLEPNLEYDRELTEKLREKARESVEPVITKINRGELIVRQGEIIRPVHFMKLRAYQEQLFKMQPPISRLYRTTGTTLLILLLFSVTIYFLKTYYPSVIRSNSRLLMLSMIVLLVLGLSWLVQQASWHLSPRMLELIRYVSPVAVGSLLLCLLFGVRVALFLSLILAFLSAMVVGYDTGYLLVGAIGGSAAVFGIKGARKRGDLLRAGLIVGGANLLTVLALGAINGLTIITCLKQGLGSAASGVAAAFIGMIILGIFESGFRLFSDIGLLELSDLNHPLLRQLMIRAPGTYHHSLVVGTLAEGMAEAVEANPLLARVGAYFHDIGKIVKPEYFSENEPSDSSSHDRLIPSMSSLILISHVKEGVALARQYRLDKRIVDIIQQHHGTSLISYFYDRAGKTDQLKFDVMEKDYRYPGPKPSSKEAAIVMIADAVEAASLSLENPTPSRLEALVRQIISERFEDSQLDECNLTLNDLKKLGEAFVRLLTARFHTRVKYPANNGRKDGPERNGGGR